MPTPSGNPGSTSGSSLANGPRPDIWIPASTEELPTAKPGTGQPSIVLLGSVASSPIVFAVPSRYVTATSALAADERDTSPGGIYKAISGSFTLTLPNPRLSETGRLGIADLYPSLTGTLGQIVRSGGYPPDSGSLLCQATQAAQVKPPAYLVSAAAVYASSHGGLGASGCSSASAGPLTVFSPVGGSVLDFPFATVTWSGIPAPAAVTKAEDALFHWLTPTVRPTPLMTDGLQAPGLTAYLPPPATIDAAVSGFTSSQPPARTLVAIDDSAPMGPYLSEIEQAVDGVLGPQGQGGDLKEGRDSFGVWTFPGAETNGTVPTEQQLVRLGPDTANQRALVQRAVAAITAQDHSAEFDLVSAAASRGSSANSLVLLTDGDDQQVDPGKNSIVTVSSQLGFLAGQGLPFKVYIIAFGPAGCAETPSGSSADSLTALAKAGGGR
jgi:Bacterial extracellular solute-binding protein